MLTADPASDSNRELVKDVRPACKSADYEFDIQRTVIVIYSYNKTHEMH